MTIDEPHDCADWAGDCPEPAEVDRAAHISRQYWPGLLTMTNTTPPFAARYAWVYIDVINFQYAYRKFGLAGFIRGAVQVVEQGRVGEISWSIQVRKGGCRGPDQCPMTPEQVEEVGRAMCATGRGLFVTFSNYEEELMTEDMRASIDRIRRYCADTSRFAHSQTR